MEKLNLIEVVPKHGYQSRGHDAHVEVGKARRYCRACDQPIPKGQKHLSLMSHLSNGYRSDIHICRECLTRALAEM